MIRVGFNARTMVDPSRRGFNRYTYSLAKALVSLGGVEVWLISDSGVHESFLRDLDVRVACTPGFNPIWWEQVVLPRTIKELRLDVFHAPATLGLPLRRECPYILTIHDMIGRAAEDLVDRVSMKARLYNRVFQAVSLHTASRVITVSEYSKHDICQHLGVRPDRVDVIYEAADEQFRRIDDRGMIDEALGRHNIRRPYVLYVGGFDRRKNVDVLIRAFARTSLGPDASLVLVGAKNGEYPQLCGRIAALGLEQRVQFTGYVSDEDLVLLYNGAALLAYPSLYEGFGLPPVEAMACGVPIIVSNTTSLPEIADGAAVLVDPTDVDDVALAIEQTFVDNDFVAGLRTRGLQVASRLSWSKTAEQTLDVYRAVMDASAPAKSCVT